MSHINYIITQNEKNSASESRYSLRKGEPDKNPNEAKGAAKKPVNPFITNKKDKPKAHPSPLLEEKKAEQQDDKKTVDKSGGSGIMDMDGNARTPKIWTKQVCAYKS